MSSANPAIDNLMKVSLSLHAGEISSDDAMGTLFEFIFGVGPAGITPFEKALHGKMVGDRIGFEIQSAADGDTLGHLEGPLREQARIMAPVSLQVLITGVRRASDREVIKAMAAGGGCGDCGCGCGNH